MGYKTRHRNLTDTKFSELTIGDIVRGSIDEKASLVPYNFRVLYVKPKETFVLANWGTFLLTKISPQKTRLIIRTQEPKSTTLWAKTKSYITAPLHFLMERRMLMGIKAAAEANKNIQVSQTKDVIWLSSIILSSLIICFLIFLRHGIIRSIIIPLIASTLWLITLLLFNPTPLYGISLLLITCLSLLASGKQGVRSS